MTDPAVLRATLIRTTAELFSCRAPASTLEDRVVAEAVDLIVTATLEHAAMLLTATARCMNPDPDDWGDDLGLTFAADGLDAAASIIRDEITAITGGSDVRLLAAINRLEAPRTDSAVRRAALFEAADLIERELPTASGVHVFGGPYSDGVADSAAEVRRLADAGLTIDATVTA